MKLYTVSDYTKSQKVLIAAAYSGASVEIDSGFKLGETNKTPEFLAKFPFGKVPALETDDGKAIFESNAIAQYVASFSDALKPSGGAYEEALVQQYTSMADNELYPAACAWVYPTYGLMPNNKGAISKGKADVSSALTALNVALATRTFLVGEKVSLADITVATTLLPVFTRVLDADQRKNFANATRWFVTCVNQPAFKGVLGDVKLCDKEMPFDGKKYNELFPKKQQPKKEKAAKQQQQPKKEKKAEKKEEKKPEKKKEEKPKDPCAALPKGTFDLNAFKAFYSNNAEDDSIKYFWEKFDAENYSIWKAEYNESLASYAPFMCNNLVGGMMQRVEKMNKYAFASVCVFGNKPDCQIHGVWIWRGQEQIFELNEDWNVDAPSYKFTKLDPNAEATKVAITEFFKWEGAFEGCGGALQDGKVFK